MHYIDGIFAAVLFIFLILGYRGGVIKVGATNLSIILGLVLATRSMGRLGAFLTTFLSIHEIVGVVMAFVGIFISIIIAQIILFAFLERQGRPSHPLDKLGGALLGGVEGMIYLSLMLVILNLYDVPSHSTRSHSFSYKPLREFAPKIFDTANSLLPSPTSFHNELASSIEKFKYLSED